MLHFKPLQTLLLVLFSTGLSAFGQAGADSSPTNIRPLLDAINVSWDVPGPTSAESMPVGNGDIGLNVWVEPNGDLLFYIGKTDAWNESVHGSKGLMKLGRVRVSMNPTPLVAGASFAQVLKLHEGEIQVSEGSVTLRVWVDANHPVIRVEMQSKQPVATKVTLENWRPASEKDVTLAGQPNRIAWYHRNGSAVEPHVANLTFGAVIKGAGLVSQGDSILESPAATSQLVSIYPLTATTPTPAEWVAQLDQQIKQVDTLNFEQTRQEHQKWWDQFWHRSWIFAKGDQAATDITTGYVLQRFITACGGRGAYPIKFNGSIFIVDNPALPDGKDKAGNVKPFKVMTGDDRNWGGQYWFQNTRAMYWPRLMAGDFDIMLPLFHMYAGILPGNTALVKQYYGHDGAYFAETAPFWGGMKYVGPDVEANYTAHYFTPILELSMMMLDYYDYTGDKKFAKETLLPVATSGLLFFDQHFGRDAGGKLLLDPDNAIEMYWKVHNPAPDIAALRVILSRMLALPDDLVDASTRAAWKKMAGEIPELPVGTRNRKRLLLPYTGEQTAQRRNGENPELYAIYPFRIYGVEKPDLELAIATFNGRTCKQKGCWVQDPIQAAMLGLTDVAKEYTRAALTKREPRLKFPAFWARGCDYDPDQDNGGNGENGFQQMLMQCEGKKIVLLPAWPKTWDGEFKLNAPYRTTVEGKVEHGKLVKVVVNPPERKADIIDGSNLVVPTPVALAPSVPNGSVKSILSAHDAIVALKQTTKGGPNVFAEEKECDHVERLIDDNIATKSLNRSQDKNGLNPHGVNSGFVVTPGNAGSESVNGFQFATSDDVPDRDPLSITIEGSNSEAGQTQAGSYVLLYDGPTGLANDPGRKQWGPAMSFKNTTAYKSYRVLVTETRGDSVDATQSSEIKLGVYSKP